MSYDVIPSVIYTSPEAASVGETGETARAKGFDFEVKKLPMMYSGRYVAENDILDGLCKVIVEKNTQRLLGVQLVGTYASEIILAAGVMIESRLPLESLKKVVFAHPTVGEIIRETIFK
jgi:dihydrolipoamide dehydrogenase